jgi:hypothetical protein
VGLGVPAHEKRRAEWQVGGPHARERGVQRWKWRGLCALGCFGLGVFPCRRRSTWVQQHCGVGSCTVVALSVWWCLLPSDPPSALDHFSGFDTRKCGCGWKLLLYFVSSVVVSSVLAVLMSQSNWSLSLF